MVIIEVPEAAFIRAVYCIIANQVNAFHSPVRPLQKLRPLQLTDTIPKGVAVFAFDTLQVQREQARTIVFCLFFFFFFFFFFIELKKQHRFFCLCLTLRRKDNAPQYSSHLSL